MALRLRLPNGQPAPSSAPFNFDAPSPDSPGSQPTDDEAHKDPTSPPTSWLPAKDMKIYDSEPLNGDVGFVRCPDCSKTVLKSALTEHSETCKRIRLGLGFSKKSSTGGKTVDFMDANAPPSASATKKGKKRKAGDDDVEIDAAEGGTKKKAKTVAKGRIKGPVNLDTQCGVINDKGLPCSRALKCKTHSMGAKRAVLGRSKAYDELLLDFQRANDPNFVEPVKRETKAEKKAARDKEREEKKRLAAEAKAAAGAAGNTPAKKKKPPAAAAAAAAMHEEEEEEDLAALDSEAEIENLAKAVRTAVRKGVIGVPLAVPNDVSSWFVQRRENFRTSSDMLAAALSKPRLLAAPNGYT
ncbi:SCA7-domain-containing protein [Exidia glandulosa HHB12029]|uniref:SCA7-domain-containing protein n=1 Tax=Exidia glandulosa HHB12029 TaxID=1314781 RepID=A0A165IA63_EXIGL|nr:SCA7-domain-containing protein [Exidia glandulosa HHB12029]KZV93114.1 SCA7-domain-containing protein [Exidia glandulosa HHB12029]